MRENRGVEQETGTSEAGFGFLEFGDVEGGDSEAGGFDASTSARERSGKDDGVADRQGFGGVGLFRGDAEPVEALE